ncbi:uncharacterized protein [Littorina saxatilis]|uniref:Chitin-binding type-4 domain-containing protein n=1 Tax=Littorina saxatilis TaxID=31220 RepID=A0AAN9BJ21_9CAEN
MMTKWTMTSVMTLVMTLRSVWGHGMMIDPPQRSSMWRYGFPDSPANYQDNELFCGGYDQQWNVNGGKCGICGDDYSDPQPRANEAGGKYGEGVIVRSYQRADVIDVSVEITANHLGYFIFKLCPNNDVSTPATQECLDQNVLKVVGPEGQDLGDKYYLDAEVGTKHVELQLPVDLTCTQCVLQWTYNTGNSWGCNDDAYEDCCIGCGKQENFVNCADIAITGSTDEQTTTTASTDAPVVTTAAPSLTTTTTTTTTTTGSVTEECTCEPAGAYAGLEEMVEWCCYNCARDHCPETHCVCS